MSPSSRGRGLKYVLGRKVTMYTIVALFTRAWIEIYYENTNGQLFGVALFTRAWIEIASLIKSLSGDTVALFTRAWIEIVNQSIIPFSTISRPLHEGVD